MTRNQAACLASAVTTLVLVATVAAVVAALPELVVVPGALEVGSAGLPAACMAVVYAVGVAMQPWLLPARRRR